MRIVFFSSAQKATGFLYTEWLDCRSFVCSIKTAKSTGNGIVQHLTMLDGVVIHTTKYFDGINNGISAQSTFKQDQHKLGYLISRKTRKGPIPECRNNVVSQMLLVTM